MMSNPAKRSRGSASRSKSVTRSKKAASRKSTRASSKKTRSKRASKPLLKLGPSNVKLPIDEIRTQLLSFGDQIQRYLGDVNAKVETFNFGIEKSGGGLAIDCQVKAVIGV